MKRKEQEQKEAIGELKANFIIPSSKIIIQITSVARSGMSRRMKVYTEDMNEITYFVARAIDCSRNDMGILITGCGMDMTFWLANALTYALYGKDKPEELKGNGGGSCGCIDWKSIY